MTMIEIGIVKALKTVSSTVLAYVVFMSDLNSSTSLVKSLSVGMPPMSLNTFMFQSQKKKPKLKRRQETILLSWEEVPFLQSLMTTRAHGMRPAIITKVTE